MQKFLNKKVYITTAGGIIILAVITLLINSSALTPDTTLPSFVSSEDSALGRESATTRYTHSDNSFSFAYPEDRSVRTAPIEDGREVITIEKKEGVGLSAAQAGIQIAVEPFDEDIALTPERIKADIPDMVMNDTQMIKVDGVQAVAFTSTDASFGASAEVWLVRGGKLHQISLPTGQAGTPDNSRVLLYSLLTTWKWNK